MKKLLQGILRKELDSVTTFNELIELNKLTAELNETWKFETDWITEFINDVELASNELL